MSDNKIMDSSKYLEGNYSSDQFEAFFQKQEDSRQAFELNTLEVYMEDYMQSLKDKRTEHHYLVEGAVLRCTHCKMEPVPAFGKTFYAPEGSDTTVLKVTSNQEYRNGSEQLFATVDDTKIFENIEPFGNCKNPPDRTAEKEAMELAGMSEEICQLGDCRYLMKLNARWENLISDTGYQEITGLDNCSAEEITMEAVLFCKHGGFIYPIDPGYIATPVDDTQLTLEEKAFAEKYGLSEEQCKALFDIREYFKEHPELAAGTTIFAFEGLGENGTDNNWNGVNKYHPNGQFGAILIVTKDGLLSYAETRASTLPDNMEKSATVKEGIYSVKSIPHPLNGGYAAIRLTQFGTDSSVLPAYNSRHGNGTAEGINLHMAGRIHSDDPENPYSTGCITVTVDEYRDFGVATGFIKDREENRTAGSDGVYRNAKKPLNYGDNAEKEFKGSMVIDRKYYEDAFGYLK